jgi:uncharacterized protein
MLARAAGMRFDPNQMRTVGLVPVALLADYAGIWLVRRTPTELFFRIAYVLIFLISVELIRGALVEMWRT